LNYSRKRITTILLGVLANTKHYSVKNKSRTSVRLLFRSRN